jgi:Fe-S-cluster-containing dehydrogenase component
MQISRRSFLKGLAVAAGSACVAPAGQAQAAVKSGSYATLIDLTKCDGCPGAEMPACVAACRTANQHKFPDPDPTKIKDYWPQNKHEDWSDKQHIFNRLTPYNWLFVQQVTVEMDGKPTQVNIPRRCMHCDNPQCVKLCPFGANAKSPDGPVYVDQNMCMGGAKCRDVCPWNVPQRQAGVGPYTKIDPIPAGGGAMFQCDLCRDRLQEGKQPACVEKCPNNAMHIGTREEIVAKAEQLRQEYQGYLYGDTQNGGTSTLYVSKVPFDKIDAAIQNTAENPQQAMRMHEAKNVLDEQLNWTRVALAAPVVGAVAAFAGAASRKEKHHAEEG